MGSTTAVFFANAMQPGLSDLSHSLSPGLLPSWDQGLYHHDTPALSGVLLGPHFPRLLSE